MRLLSWNWCAPIMGAWAIGLASLAFTSGERVHGTASQDRPGGASRQSDLAAQPLAGQALLDAANQALSVTQCALVELDLNIQLGQPFTIDLPLDGNVVQVNLHPHSVRSAGYRVLMQVADGSYVEVEPGVVRTVRGGVEQWPGAVVAGSVMEDGVHLVIAEAPGFEGGGKWWIEPLAPRLPGAGIDPSLHAIYRQADVLGCCGICGVEADMDGNDQPQGQGENAQGGIAGGEICITQMACDADVEYFETYGGVPAVEAQINNVTNSMNLQYEGEVGISHAISTIIVRTEEPDPYDSTHHVSLLNEFRNHWLEEQKGVVRDVAQLFTGKDLDGNVIGVAFTIGAICTDEAYCLSQSDFTSNFSCKTDLSAHELGHLWDASHCSCPTSTMNPNITCTNTFTPSGQTISQIIAHRDSRPCIECGADPPTNDDCSDAILIAEGTSGFDNIAATTDGPPHPACADGTLTGNIANDVWFNVIASCTGELEASTCDLVGFDSRIAVYDGCDCQLNDSTLLGCDDNTSGCASGSSSVTVPVVGGQCYTIRVGGTGPGSEGSGGVSLTCFGEPLECPADLDSSGDVGPADLAGLLAAWGTNPNGPPDFDDNNNVGAEDLAELLANWGACGT